MVPRHFVSPVVQLACSSKPSHKTSEDILEINNNRKRKLLRLRQDTYRDRKRKKKSALRENAWHLIQQAMMPISKEDETALTDLSAEYSADVTQFMDAIYSSRVEDICNVCGRLSKSPRQYKPDNKIFDPLRVSQGIASTTWTGYKTERNPQIVCHKCLVSLKKKQIPKFSRTNIPVADYDLVLSNLSDLERLLISPILPMTYIWRYNAFGQYKSKGQCIAFHNDIHQISLKLPRCVEEVMVHLQKPVFGRRPFVRVKN